MSAPKTIFARVTLALMVLFAPLAAAQETGEPDNPNSVVWQETITGQIEAFRNDEAAAALSFAGRGFRANDADPEQFVTAIRRSGYGPILDSTAHSFGDFERPADNVVLQSVTLFGDDQRIYTALYQMVREDGDWKVYGVTLRQDEGVAI